MYLLEKLIVGALFGIIEPIHHFSVVVLHHLNSVSLVFIRDFIHVDLVLLGLLPCFQLFLLVIELVLKSQKVLIQRDSISEERFIARSLVLLVDFLVLEQLDLSLHRCNLLVQVQNDVFVDDIALLAPLLPLVNLLHLVSSGGQLGMTLVLLVNDGARRPVVDIEIVRGELHVAC